MLITDSEWDKTVNPGPGSTSSGLSAVCWVRLSPYPHLHPPHSSLKDPWALCLLGKCLWSIFDWVCMLSTRIIIWLTPVLINSFVWSVLSHGMSSLAHCSPSWITGALAKVSKHLSQFLQRMLVPSSPAYPTPGLPCHFGMSRRLPPLNMTLSRVWFSH